MRSDWLAPLQSVDVPVSLRRDLPAGYLNEHVSR